MADSTQQEILQIKTMEDVFSNFVEWVVAKTDKISDFNVGSAIRTLSESIALQFEEFYFDIKQNVLYAIENSIYYAFDFNLKVANAATGTVRVNFTTSLQQSMTFPIGVIFCTSSQYGYLYFESTEQVTAPYGAEFIHIPVQCKTTGTIGNIPVGAISVIMSTNSAIEEVYNDAPFTNGQDDETKSERKKRFQNYIKTLARGTRDAIVYGALEVEGVAGAIVDDEYIGYVKLYVHDEYGDLPSELKSAVLQNIQNYRAGGIEVEVLNVTKHMVDIDLTIIMENDYSIDTYTSMFETLIANHMNDYSVSENFYLADLIHAIMNVYDDVIVNVIPNDVNDAIIEQNELIRCGQLNLDVKSLREWRA